LSALGVPDDDVATAGFGQHGGRNFAGEGPFLAPGDILTAMATFVFLAASAAVEMAVKGGAMMMSQCVAFLTSG